MNDEEPLRIIVAVDGTVFAFRRDFTGDVRVTASHGELSIASAAILELVAKGFVAPVRERQLRKAGLYSTDRQSRLEGCDARSLILGVDGPVR